MTSSKATCAVVLASAFLLNAEVNARLAAMPDGTSQIQIVNDTDSEVAAFAIGAIETNKVMEGGRLVVYRDSTIDPAAAVIVPHQARSIYESQKKVMTRERKETRIAVFQLPIAVAAIFTDGRTTGDPVLLYQLMLRRRNMLQAVEISLEILSGAGRRNVPREQLVGQFKKMEQSVDRWYLGAEQQVGRRLYLNMISKLLALPEGQLGAAFPPDVFVVEETRALSRQRAMLLEAQPALASVRN